MNLAVMIAIGCYLFANAAILLTKFGKGDMKGKSRLEIIAVSILYLAVGVILMSGENK